MNRELKPAHEVIVARIQDHCQTIIAFETMSNRISQKGDPLMPIMSEMARGQQIGGLDTLLSTLQEMIIPQDKLPAVIEALEQLAYRHAIIPSAIESLKKRAIQADVPSPVAS